ncbi:DUF4397 domain-containing protein [Amnibacterium endophyticum]|uniref:DUF4397 domain-containing protein n=1 Tax=Amnibacterium endophyticum TaxID=2109337 RepID=A0ABW4LGV3_9MICO
MIRRPRLAVLAAAAAALALVVAPTAPATAATRDGWVRLAHMSPDTAAVDVTLSSLSGGVLFRLDDVAYGAISPYMKLPQGTYALAMRPAGSTDPNATPVVSGSVEVTAGEAETVAAIGLNKDLETKAFSDDLAEAAGDRAKVRIVQAAVTHDAVTVDAGSTSVADGAKFGSIGDYVSVPAGKTALKLSSGSDTATVDEDFAAGSAHTLFVIDDAKGGLTLATALDSAASTVAPVGALAAGGGGLAAGDAGLAGLLAAGAAGAGILLTGAMVRGRRRTVRV